MTKPDENHLPDEPGETPGGGYVPPAVTFLGTLADLTQKDVGATDGTTFLGVDLGS